MMAVARPLRVAVVGASGIGKHHAKWWALEGAEVCGFVGTSDASVACTHEALAKLFAFGGRGYTSLDALLDEEAPDIIDVCCPQHLHAAYCRTALEAGCDVLCEKPLFYDPGQSPDAVIEEARALMAMAAEKKRRLAVCTQYAKGADVLARIWREVRGGEPITRYHGHLESPAKGRTPDPGRVWVDLSPHLLSVVLRLWPRAEVDWLSLEVDFQGYQARATFTIEPESGPPVACDLVTRNAMAPPLNVRHFKLNGYAFNVEGENDAEGNYQARIETADGDFREPDMMRLLIRDMIQGREPVSAAEALDNLAWMLQIIDFAKEA